MNNQKINIWGTICSIFFGIFCVGFTVWGIYWSFHRHGIIDGAISVVIPPYAIYRGVSSIWEEPKWKEEFDLKTEHIAILLESSGSNFSDPSMEARMSELKHDTKKWIKKLPKEEQKVLKNTAIYYGEALMAYFNAFKESERNGFKDDPFKLFNVLYLQDRFSHISGFYRIWERNNSNRRSYYQYFKNKFEDLSIEEKILYFDDIENSEDDEKLILERNQKDVDRNIKDLFE